MGGRLGAVMAAAWALACAGGAAAEAPPAAKCTMYQLGELKVNFSRNRPLLQGAVNGQSVVVLVDTGAERSMLYRAKAQDLHLRLDDIPGMRMGGAGGVSRAQAAYVQELQIAGAKLHNFTMLVAGEGRADFDVLLGEDFLGRYDVEFDLAHDTVRLLQPKNCSDADMPYWAKGAYDQTPIVDDHGGRIGVNVKINGRQVRALLDSGAQTSVATPRAAAAAGVALQATDSKSRGIGGTVGFNEVGVLGSFTIGDETIRNTRLRFADLFANTTFSGTGSLIAKHSEGEPDMLLGADFLKSHRVMISRARHMVYFTYEGGPVFDYARRPAAPPVWGDPKPASGAAADQGGRPAQAAASRGAPAGS